MLTCPRLYATKLATLMPKRFRSRVDTNNIVHVVLQTTQAILP